MGTGLTCLTDTVKFAHHENP